MHDNVFKGILFGDISFRILGAFLTDLMHAFLHDFIPFVVKTIVPPPPLTTKEKCELELLVDSILIPT